LKATLEFTLPDEQYEFDCARRGENAMRILNDLCDRKLRDALKYGTPLTLEELRDWVVHELDLIDGEIY
jgi:hypothetical protein